MADQSSSMTIWSQNQDNTSNNQCVLDTKWKQWNPSRPSQGQFADTDRKNLHRKDLPPLQSGDPVHVQPITQHQREWKPGVVTRPLGSRTYEVSINDGSTLRRNRQTLLTRLICVCKNCHRIISWYWNVVVQTKQFEQELQKLSSLQSELKTAQQQIAQLKEQFVKVLSALLLALTSLQHVCWAMGRITGLGEVQLLRVPKVYFWGAWLNLYTDIFVIDKDSSIATCVLWHILYVLS